MSQATGAEQPTSPQRAGGGGAPGVPRRHCRNKGKRAARRLPVTESVGENFDRCVARDKLSLSRGEWCWLDDNEEITVERNRGERLDTVVVGAWARHESGRGPARDKTGRERHRPR